MELTRQTTGRSTLHATMRILHTSDWHLGHTLHGFDRTHEFDSFLDWLLDALDREKVDALLVAGDVFDTANPPASAQARLYRFLAEARSRMPALQIVLIAGNHDSGARLEAPSPLLGAFGITVVGAPARRADGTLDPESLVVPLHRADRSVGAWCLAVPFLRPADVPRVQRADDAYAAGIARLYADALEAAKARRSPGEAIIAMGHCHLTGGKVSEDSERRIVVGGAEAMSAEVFGPEIAYVALGHLHLAQSVGRAHRRYSGSPLPFSFGEVGYPHQVLIVDLEGAALKEIRELRVPRWVPMLRVPEQPAPLAEVLEALRALDPTPCDEPQRPYLEVRVRLDAPEPGLRARIEEALEGKPVRLARIDRSRSSSSSGDAAPVMTLDALERIDPAEVFGRVYRDRYGSEAPPPFVDALRELLSMDAEVTR